MAEQHYFLGIDLGTTNSSIHWGALNPTAGRIEPRPLPFDQRNSTGAIERRVLLPSYIWFQQNEPTPAVGEYARTRGLEAQPSRVARAIKNHMGRDDWRFEVDGNAYTPAQLAAILLRTMAAGIERTWGSAVADVIITVPASFDSDMRQDTLEAAGLAGFKISERDSKPRNLLLDEPRAALYDLLNQQLAGHLPPGLLDLSTPKMVLVFDLGGGTLDVSLHRVRQAAEAAEMGVEDLAISRYSQLGGGVFDSRLADELQRRFEERTKIKLAALSPVEQNQLRVKFEVQAEHVKQRLTNDIEERINHGATQVPDDFAVDVHMPFIYDNKGLITRLTKKEFDAVLAPLLGAELTLDAVEDFDQREYAQDNIVYPILDVLHKARKGLGHTPKVDAVVLNGGMTRIHAVRDRLEELLGVSPIRVLDPELAVSRGAAIYHYLLHRGWRPRQILAESIGVEVEGGQIFHLVPAGTVLPHRQSYPRKFTLPADGSRTLTIPLYRGERKLAGPPNKKILERKFVFQQPQAQGTSIDVEISIDENKVIEFIATLPNGERAEVRVGAENGSRDSTAPTTTGGPSRETSPAPPSSGPPIDVGQFWQAFRAAAQQWDEAQLKVLGNRMLGAGNAGALVDRLLKELPSLNRPGRQRTMWVLGEFGRRQPGDPRVKHIVNACLRGLGDSLGNPQAIATIGRFAAVALGKVGSSVAESRLVNLLNDSRVEAIRGDLLMAIGKCGASVNAVSHVGRFISSARDGERIGALWALGRLGGREHDPVIPITSLADLLPEIGQRTSPSIELHVVARKYAIYALGEIGDRRADLHHQDVVDDAHAEYIRNIMNRVLKDISGLNLYQSKYAHEYKLMHRLATIALKQVEGQALTEDESRVLMSVRTLMAAGDDE